jgi:hypothetical protein
MRSHKRKESGGSSNHNSGSNINNSSRFNAFTSDQRQQSRIEGNQSSDTNSSLANVQYTISTGEQQGQSHDRQTIQTNIWY